MFKERREETQRVLLLLKIDAKNLYDRITRRKQEYLTAFSLKRTREHFKDVFENRYKSLPIDDLKLCSVDVITALDNYYTKIETFYWYLKHTEDMPAMVEDKIHRFVKEIKHEYEVLFLYIDAELTVTEEKLKEESQTHFDSSEAQTDESEIPSFQLEQTEWPSENEDI